jgi:hypothetical protein
MEENEGEFLKVLMELNRNAVGFRERLQSLMGVFEEWKDGDEVYFSANGKGLEVLTGADGDVRALLLFGLESREVSRYKGPLPAGLDFGFSRDQVRSLLGEPDESGEPKLHLGEIIPPWDKYHLIGYSLHAQYALDGSMIGRVTLTPSNA